MAFRRCNELFYRLWIKNIGFGREVMFSALVPWCLGAFESLCLRALDSLCDISLLCGFRYMASAWIICCSKYIKKHDAFKSR